MIRWAPLLKQRLLEIYQFRLERQAGSDPPFLLPRHDRNGHHAGVVQTFGLATHPHESGELLKMLIGVAPALVAGSVALITVRFTARAFYRQRWWERKADAYSKVIEALYYRIEYWSQAINEYLNDEGPKGEAKLELERRFREAESELSKAAGVGAYIISDEAAEVLEKLLSHPKRPTLDSAPWDTFDEIAVDAKKALRKIRALAKQDLGM